MERAFEKWEGLGNDFVLLRASSAEEWPSQAEIRAMCDRRRGIGADGVLLVETAGDRPRMIVFNADGSRPEMCGNGLRCVAAALTPRESSSELSILTDDGEKRCRVERAGALAQVAVAMGRAVLEPEHQTELGGRALRFARVSTGNPHAVTFEPFDRAAIEEVGPLVERGIVGGANVEFARARESGIDVVVWERGVGFTDACGTGACAVGVVACSTGRAAFGEPIEVRLPGGPLRISVEAETLEVEMRGPARLAFQGTWSG